MKTVVTDTHPLMYYFCGAQKKLSKTVKLIFDDAVTGSSTIYVPSVVLWELADLEKRGKMSLKPSYAAWIKRLFSCRSLVSQPFDENTAVLYHQLQFHTDPFDKAIVATALQLELPLITNDSVIHREKPCSLLWD